MAGSKEFEKARDELVSSYVELLAKVGLTIVSSGKTTGVVTKVVDGKEVISKGNSYLLQKLLIKESLSEIIASSNMEGLREQRCQTYIRRSHLKILLKTNSLEKLLQRTYGKSLGAVTGLVEVGQAAEKVCDNV